MRHCSSRSPRSRTGTTIARSRRRRGATDQGQVKSEATVLAEQALTALKEQPTAPGSPAPSAPVAPVEAAPVATAPAAETPIPAEPAPIEIPEGPGRIPQIGRREAHRLPSADEILASLEAEMARQEREEAGRAPTPPAAAAPSATPSRPRRARPSAGVFGEPGCLGDDADPAIRRARRTHREWRWSARRAASVEAGHIETRAAERARTQTTGAE